MAGYLEHLPKEIARFIRTQLVAQYASVSGAGVPLDTPAAAFTSADLRTLDLATGVAYPAKAERARRNPKVGLLIESDAGGPVVSIAGMATVRDADLQANLDRYMAETVLIVGNTSMTDWEATRQAIWYYTRIFVLIRPIHVRWWPERSAMDEAPSYWRATDADIAPSDPAPSGPATPAPDWPQPSWQQLREQALGRNAPGHLTLLDEEGYPLPIGVTAAESSDEGFRLKVPAGAPWNEGKASLSFQGVEMFVGHASRRGSDMILAVERALPLFPLSADPAQVIRPTPENRAILMERLGKELARRGQTMPVMPQDRPQPTEGALYRAAAASARQ